MMKEPGRAVTAKEAGDADLAASGWQQVDSANDEVDVLSPVVYGHGKLVGPVAVSIPEQHVAALLCRILLLQSELTVLKFFNAGFNPHTPAVAVSEWIPLVAARSGIVQFNRIRCRCYSLPGARRRRSTRTVARVDETFRSQDFETLAIDRITITLPAVASAASERVSGIDVRPVAQPVEIVENPCFELRPRSNAIVILDAKEHPSIPRPGAAPHVLRVEDMAQMQPAGGRGCEASEQNYPEFRRFQLSVLSLQSDIGHRTSDIGHRTSDIGPRTPDPGSRTQIRRLPLPQNACGVDA
jgi:hypothetical protein